MKKSDLKTGMRVETRDGEIYLVLKDIDTYLYGHQEIGFAGKGFLVGDDYNEDMTFDSDDDYDIVKVYVINDKYNDGLLCRHTLDLSKRILVWEREDDDY